MAVVDATTGVVITTYLRPQHTSRDALSPVAGNTMVVPNHEMDRRITNHAEPHTYSVSNTALSGQPTALDATRQATPNQTATGHHHITRNPQATQPNCPSATFNCQPSMKQIKMTSTPLKNSILSRWYFKTRPEEALLLSHSLTLAQTSAYSRSMSPKSLVLKAQ